MTQCANRGNAAAAAIVVACALAFATTPSARAQDSVAVPESASAEESAREPESAGAQESAGARQAPPAGPPAAPAPEAPPAGAEDPAAAPGPAGPATPGPPRPRAAPEAHDKAQLNAPSLLSTAIAPNKKAWEEQQGGYLGSRLAIARRLTDRPERLLTARDSLPRDREKFLWRVARDTWTGLQAYSDRENGLIVDNVRIEGGLVPPLALKIGDYTSITNIGLQLASIAAAQRLGLVAPPDARALASRILDTLADLPRHDGFFFNYYDTTSLEPTSSFVSFVDTAWLIAGLMVTRQAFPDLAGPVNDLLEPQDLHWFYDDSTGLMSHGYYVNMGTLSAFEYGYFYTEARLGSLVAIGKGDAPVSHWFAMRRATRPLCDEGECPQFHQLRYLAPEDDLVSVSYFRWRSHQYVPSWGGSMFEALMPRLFLDESRWAPRSLGPNGEAHARLQKIHADETLGVPVFGMSPCMSPATGRYQEFGVRALGSHGYDESVVTPHAAALALAVTPDDAAIALMELAQRYDVYGPFGFYDAVEPATGKVAYDQLALDQLMLFLAVANHLSDDYVPGLFADDPWVTDALPLLAEERFFE